MNTLCLKDKCKRCDVGYIIKDYVKPLMQALTNDLKEYNMRLVTSKCLNTAVSFMFLFFGKRALKDTVYCDVDNVVSRHESFQENSSSIIDHLKKDVLRKTQSRYVYYVMLTDGYMQKPDGTEVFFPGHVMVWEKIPWGKEPFYYIYQSYIDKYDFNTSFQFKTSLKIPFEKMEYYISSIERMVKNRVWDEGMVRFWKDLTNVGSDEFLGARAPKAFYLCYRKKMSKYCIKYLKQYVDQKLKTIPRNKEDDIYGDELKYDDDANPLTNAQVKASLSQLQSRLEKYMPEK
jgi:hypothetical protein